MLTAIAKLSPIRKMIDFNQNVTFPENIPQCCSQDSFIFIVKKLLEDSQRLIGLHSIEPQLQLVDLGIDTELTLNARDYHRCLQYEPNLRVSESFIERKELRTELAHNFPLSFTPSVRKVSIYITIEIIRCQMI